MASYPKKKIYSLSPYIPMIFLLFLIFTSIVKGSKTIPAIFAFGDSYSDQGNNDYIHTIAKGNFLPYGQDFMGGNHPTGRFSNGKTFTDLIAEELDIKEFVLPYLDPNLLPEDLVTGVSFGSGGSGYDPQTSSALAVLSISKQLELFKEYIEKLKVIAGEDESKNILSKSIFLIIFGTVDLANTYFTVGERKLQYGVASYADFLVQIASNFVQDLYSLGARRVFVFGVPPIGCLPFQRTIKGGLLRLCSNEENEAAVLYNTKLSSALTIINNGFSDSNVTVAYVDYYNPLYNLIQHYTDNGFSVADRGCCGTGLVEATFFCNPTTPTCADDMAYIFWDSYHPTEYGNRVLVNQFVRNSFNIFIEA